MKKNIKTPREVADEVRQFLLNQHTFSGWEDELCENITTTLKSRDREIIDEERKRIAQYLTNTFKDKSEIGVNHLLLELGKLSDDHLK